jgi:hypothetical protein
MSQKVTRAIQKAKMLRKGTRARKGRIGMTENARIPGGELAVMVATLGMTLPVLMTAMGARLATLLADLSVREGSLPMSPATRIRTADISTCV